MNTERFPWLAKGRWEIHLLSAENDEIHVMSSDSLQFNYEGETHLFRLSAIVVDTESGLAFQTRLNCDYLVRGCLELQNGDVLDLLKDFADYQ